MQADTAAKIEFAVQMICEKCENTIKNNLQQVQGINSVQADWKSGSVVVNTVLSTNQVRQRITDLGFKTVVRGLGNLAAVAMLDIGRNVKGVVRFVQITNKCCIVDGTIDGLVPSTNCTVSIHECGDISQGCASIGEYYNPTGASENQRIYGLLGTVTSDEKGRAQFRFEDEVLRLPDVIGRALCITKVNGNRKERVSCGIIARSAGLFQNPKTICACDGVSIWDEIGS